VTYPGVPIYRCVLVREKRTLKLTRAKIGSSYQAACIVEQLTEDSPVEKLCCIYLDGAGQLIGAEVVATGTETSVACTPSTVLRGAIIHCARAIIVGHNHPSGDPKPSQADLVMTRVMQLAADAVGIALFDHVVVAHGVRHHSMRESSHDLSWSD